MSADDILDRVLDAVAEPGRGRPLRRGRGGSSAAALQSRPPGRQGPGPDAGRAGRALDLALARRAGGVAAGRAAARPGVGAGTELAQLRPYQVGDDVRQLDPAATARTGVPHVRLQVPERPLTTWLVLDMSAVDGLRHRRAAEVRRRRGRRRGGRRGSRSGAAGALALMTCGGDRAAAAAAARRARARCVGARARCCAEGVGADGAPAAAERSPGALRARCAARARAPGWWSSISDFRDPRAGARARRARPRATRRSPSRCATRARRALPDVGHLSLVDPESGELVRGGQLRPRPARALRGGRAPSGASRSPRDLRARAGPSTSCCDDRPRLARAYARQRPQEPAMSFAAPLFLLALLAGARARRPRSSTRCAAARAATRCASPACPRSPAVLPAAPTLAPPPPAGPVRCWRSPPLAVALARPQAASPCRSSGRR